MIDMMKIMGQFKEVQAKIKAAQENLDKITASGESGAGMVKVVANGKKQIVSLEVDQDLVKPEDREMMQDLIIAAVNKALQEVEIKAKEEMQKSTSGMFPNIPGLDLSGLV